MDPNAVVSPKSRIKDVRVIYTDKEDGFSIATLVLDGNKNRVAMRWDGDENGLGFPVSRGRATWFIIPKIIAMSFAKQINNVAMQQRIASCDD